MINQIALVKSFIDKDALIKKYDFSHYIISYEKEKLNNIISKGVDNSIFYISDNSHEFNRIFFKMGFLYNMFKKNDFKGLIKIGGKTYQINSFIDYFTLFEFKSHFYINATIGEKKFSFTYINYNKSDEYYDILQDFMNFNNLDNYLNISFIYDISISKNRIKLLDLHQRLNKKNIITENIFKDDNIEVKIEIEFDDDNFKDTTINNDDIKKPLLPVKKKYIKPLDYKVVKPPPLKKKNNEKSNKLFTVRKIPPKKKKVFPPKPIIKDISFLKPPPPPKFPEKLPPKPNTASSEMSILDDIINLIDLINDPGYQPLCLPINKNNNKEIIKINYKLHKKIINNFHKLKLSDKKLDIQKKIVSETISLLKECIDDLTNLS